MLPIIAAPSRHAYARCGRDVLLLGIAERPCPHRIGRACSWRCAPFRDGTERTPYRHRSGSILAMRIAWETVSARRFWPCGPPGIAPRACFTPSIYCGMWCSSNSGPSP